MVEGDSKMQPSRAGDVMKIIPTAVLHSLVKFWSDPALCEWNLQRFDKEWKVKVGGYQKGQF